MGSFCDMRELEKTNAAEGKRVELIEEGASDYFFG